MSLQVFLLPDLGEGLTEAELVNWLVEVGDEIIVDQPIAEVETAKSVVEVPSPFAGLVAVLHGETGQTMDVGKPLISVQPKAAGSVASEGSVTAEGSGNVLIGYGTSGHGAGGRTRPPKKPLRHGAAAVVLVEATAGPGGAADPGDAGGAGGPGRPGAPLVISPLVRNLARDNGVALRLIAGSGPRGLILRKDVEAAVAGQSSAGRAGMEPENASARAVDDAVPDGVQIDAGVQIAAGERDVRTGLIIRERTPLKGLRKTVAANLTRSRSEIPEATVWVDVDATALVELRRQLKQTRPDSTPGLLAFIARFVTAGLARYPELNTRIESTPDGHEIVALSGVNLGFAAQTDRGLMVPSVEHAENLSARELDAEIRRLTAVVRQGKATPAELTRGTFTLNNYGIFGVDGSAAIINFPESAILGVGRIMDKPWVVDGALAVRKLTELTLVFDHRVCDGGTAGGFLRYVADAIENPSAILADL